MNSDWMIDNIRQVNGKFVTLMESLSVQQLNEIPSGFSNNIIWNYGHLIATQQRLFYGLSGFPVNIEASFMEKYQRGSKLEGFVSEAEVDDMKQLFISCIDKLEADFNAGIFTKFTPYTTATLGITMNNIEEAIITSTVHDGWHLGCASMIKKFV